MKNQKGDFLSIERHEVFGVKNFIVISDRRNTMKSSTQDQAEGKFHKVKGKLKEIAGKLNDDPKLEAEGTGEKTAGKVQEKIGQVKKVLGK
jgi:uncharacterized protein YjbJ (UPF0337 family)